MKSIVIPLIASPFNYDVGFIHANTQQLKLNDERDLLKLYDDHQGSIFNLGINTSNYLNQIRVFLDFVKKYCEHDELKKESIFFYDEESKIYGEVGMAIFGHPPAEKFEDSSSFHRYHFIVTENPIDVLSSELVIEEGNSNISYFNIQRIHIAPLSDEIDLRKYEGKKVEVTGKFMGGHTAWHRTDVLIWVTNIKEVA